MRSMSTLFKQTSPGLIATARRWASTSAVGGVSVSSHRDFLRVRIGAAAGATAAPATHYDFHWFWLRHLCPETPYSRHPATGERTLDAAEVPLDIQPQGVRVLGAAEGATEPTVEIAWGPVPHAHASRYPVAWLLRHAYGKDHVEVAPPLSDPAAITLDFGRYATDAAGRPPAAYYEDVRLRMRRHGAVVVRGRGFDTEAIMYVGDRIRAGTGTRGFGRGYGRAIKEGKECSASVRHRSGPHACQLMRVPSPCPYPAHVHASAGYPTHARTQPMPVPSPCP